MSTEPIVSRRLVARGALALLAVACAATAVSAAEVDFRPAMSFGVFHDGNLAVIGGGRGDEGATLAFDLTWDRKTPMSLFAFSYRPSYVTYRRSGELDYFGNTIVLGFARDSSRASRFTVDGRIARTDYQGQTADTADRATTFVPRTTLTQADVKVGGTAGTGRRGFFDWQLRGGIDRYKDLKDDPATVVVDPRDFNDATSVAGRIAWRHELSVRNTLGLGLDLSHFGYENTPGVLVERFGLVGTHHAGASWLLNYAVGASRANSNGDSIDGFSFDLKVEYADGKDSTFGAGARQEFAPGTGLGASTQDRGVFVSYAHAPTARGLSGSVVGGYWKRKALQFAGSTATGDSAAFTVNGAIGWNFNRYLGLDGSYAYVDQSAGSVADPQLNTSYSSYGLYLRWAIRGR